MTQEQKNRLFSPAMTAPLLSLFVIIAMRFSRFALEKLSPETDIFVAAALIQLAVLALPCIIYYLIKGKKLSEPMYLLSPKNTNLLFLLFAALLFVSGMLLIKYFMFVLGVTSESLTNYYGEGLISAEGESPLRIILSLIIIPAVCEELLFRGIVFTEYRRYGVTNAVVMSAICFTMLHFSVGSAPVYLFTGLLLGFVTAVSRSIFPAVALHILSNTLSVYASDAFLRVTIVKNGAYFIGFVLTVLAGVSLVLMLSRTESILYRRAAESAEDSFPPQSRGRVMQVFLSPTFLLLCIAFFLLYTFL